MSAISSFESSDFGSLKIWVDDQKREYYRAIDVCYALKHSNPSQAVSRLVDEDYVFQIKDGTNRAGTVNYVSEPGLYQLIFASKTEAAKKFQRWVFEDVLPKLRAEGYYRSSGITQQQLQAEVDSALLEGENRGFQLALSRVSNPEAIIDPTAHVWKMIHFVFRIYDRELDWQMCNGNGQLKKTYKGYDLIGRWESDVQDPVRITRDDFQFVLSIFDRCGYIYRWATDLNKITFNKQLRRAWFAFGGRGEYDDQIRPHLEAAMTQAFRSENRYRPQASLYAFKVNKWETYRMGLPLERREQEHDHELDEDWYAEN